MELYDTTLFRGVSKTDCEKMTKCFSAEKRNYSSGEKICTYSEMGNYVGILLTGSAKVMRNDYQGNLSLLERLEENSLFGKYTTLIPYSGEGIYVMCETDSTVFFIKSECITKRCANACVCHSTVVSNMLDIMSAKSVGLYSHLIVLSNRTIREKLMCYFQFLSANCGSRSFELPFSTTALAEYICVDRSAMMRELRKMKDEGLIKMNRRAVTIEEFQ